jgi:hypothetical protein
MSQAEVHTSAAPAAAAAAPAITFATVRREAAMIAVAAVTYGGIRAVTEGRTDVAEQNAYDLLGLQRTLGLAWEEWIQSLIIGREALVALANWVYIYGHWPVIATVAVLLFVWRRDRYRLLRNAVFVSGAIGFFFFALVPVAPPRLLELGLVDTVAERSAAYRALQPPELTNQYAALPSLHFGWNLLVGIVLFGTTRRLAVRAFALVMPAAMAFAVVATANHFVIDVAVAGTVVLVGLAVATRLQPAAPPGAYGSPTPGADPVRQPAQLRRRLPRPAAQEAMILVKGGYTPDTIVVERGKPVRLTFVREESSPCSEQVVFDAFGKHAALPEGKQVAVELLPTEPGEYPFTCQTSMLRGTLVVE